MVDENVVNEDEDNETTAFKAMIKQFEGLWGAVTDAPTEQAYENAWNVFSQEFGRPERSPRLIKYIQDTWIPFRFHFMHCWTDRYQHWGIKVTSRMEACHWRLKDRLRSSQGDFRTVILAIIGLISDSFLIYCQELDKAQHTNQFRYHIPLLQRLIKSITPFAMAEVYGQWKLVKDHIEGRKQLKECQGTFTRTMGLPCRHTINEKINRQGGDPQAVALRKGDIHYHWWYRPGTISRRQVQDEESDDNNNDGDDNEDLRVNFDSDATSLSPPREPAVKLNPKGRPRGSMNKRQRAHEHSTRRDPSREEVWEKNSQQEAAVLKNTITARKQMEKQEKKNAAAKKRREAAAAKKKGGTAIDQAEAAIEAAEKKAEKALEDAIEKTERAGQKDIQKARENFEKRKMVRAKASQASQAPYSDNPILYNPVPQQNLPLQRRRRRRYSARIPTTLL